MQKTRPTVRVMQDIPHAWEDFPPNNYKRPRDHAQAETDADIQGQTLRFEDDADGGKGYIAVGSHKVQDDIIEIKEKVPMQPGSPTRKEARRLRSGSPSRREKWRIGLWSLLIRNRKFMQDRVAEGGGNAPPGSRPRRQQDKHEDRIQNNVEDAAQGNKEPRLL